MRFKAFLVTVTVACSSVAHAALPPIDWTSDIEVENQATRARTKLIGSLTAFGVAAIGVAVGIAFGIGALDIRTTLEKSPGASLSWRHEKILEGEQTRLVANIGWGVAAGAGTIGIIVVAF